MVLRNIAFVTLFLVGTALIYRYLILHHWKKGAAILAGVLISSVVEIIAALIFIKLPSDLILSLFILILIIIPILRILVMDNTYVPADRIQGMGYQERHEIELKECPNCGLKNYASTKTCLSCGRNLNENSPVPDENTVNPIDSLNQVDPLSGETGYAPDPDHFESDEIDRRSAVFVLGILLSLAVMSLLIYLLNG